MTCGLKESRAHRASHIYLFAVSVLFCFSQAVHYWVKPAHFLLFFFFVFFIQSHQIPSVWFSIAKYKNDQMPWFFFLIVYFCDFFSTRFRFAGFYLLAIDLWRWHDIAHDTRMFSAKSARWALAVQEARVYGAQHSRLTGRITLSYGFAESIYQNCFCFFSPASFLPRILAFE